MIEETVARARVLLASTKSLETLKPRDEDYAAVFVPEVAERARAGYQGLWSQVPPWPVRPEQTELRIGAAFAEDFATENARVRPFPGGYRDVARYLIADRVWIVWEHVAPGAKDGILFDGLVALDDHFAWFPKPWRVVGAASP